MQAPVLTTERLILRMPVRTDFEAFAALMADPRTTFMGGPFDLKGAWSLFAISVANWSLDGFGGWIIADRTTGAFLGEISIIHPATFPEPELGWSLTSAAEGRGIAGEAAQAVLHWWWTQTGNDTVVSYVHPQNARSIALVQRLGGVPDHTAAREEPDDLVFRHSRPPEAA